MAYQVCECTRSVPAQPSAMARSTPEGLQRAVGAGQLGQVGVRRRARLVARAAERVHAGVEVVAGAQRAHQLGDVDPGAAVDLGRVLLAQHVDSHAGEPTAARRAADRTSLRPMSTAAASATGRHVHAVPQEGPGDRAGRW